MRLVESVQNPAHTGNRRCLPCTIANVALLWVTSNVLVLVGWPLLAALLGVLGAVLIWVRGYLVPYTPRFAPRLLAISPLPETWFHEPTAVGGLAGTASDGERELAALEQAGLAIVRKGTITLAPDFERQWHAEMDRLATLPLADLAKNVESVPAITDARPVEAAGKRWLAVDGRPTLVPQHVAVAELAAVHLLESVPISPEDRLGTAQSLRNCLVSCPVCGTQFERTSARRCCGRQRDSPEGGKALACPTCGQRFLTLSES